MNKKRTLAGKTIWRLDNTYEFIVEEKSKYVVTLKGDKILKTNINLQPKSGQPVELGEWVKNH